MSIEYRNYIHKPESIKPLAELAQPADQLEGSVLSDEKIDQIKMDLTNCFESVATDLSTNNLAKNHVNALIDHLVNKGAQTEHELLVGGSREFLNVSLNVLGPLWSSYVNEVFNSGEGGEVFLFPARDATPMYQAAKGILSKPNKYEMEESTLVHADWNRWFMGQEDETEANKKSFPLEHPYMEAFYKQMGFGSGRLINIVEPGAWGSAANALKTQMPDQKFNLWFMFSHMPDRIYGYLNEHAPGADPKTLEMINDTVEAVPKSYLRPETFTKIGGFVLPDVGDKVVDSLYLQTWTKAALIGAYAAGVDYSAGKRVDIDQHVNWLKDLSDRAKMGEWTGVLSGNSMTWTEGEEWKRNWKWGQIPPLK